MSFDQRFAQPTAAYRSIPLWTWNGEMTEARITEMLEQYAQQGMGGVFVHPRPGLQTEYLSERWFELWGFALDECKRLGLECAIYDENSYPTGFAGGHVSARLPYASAQIAKAELWESGPWRHGGGEILGAYWAGKDGAAPEPVPMNTMSIDEAIERGPVLVTYLRKLPPEGWTAWFPMTDITRPEVMQEFIETTYVPYRERFGKDFGAAIPMIFADEPHYRNDYGTGLFFTHYVAREFFNDHGYEIEDHLAEIFLDCETSAAVRFDYFKTAQRLWVNNAIKPLYDWCDANGIAFTGHWYEHEWPYASINGDAMEAYRYQHIPAIDLLAPQYKFEAPETSELFLMTARQMNSVANQFGRPVRLCEAHGVGGHEYTFDHIKRLNDWLLVHGVNRICEHLSFQTISGARKFDHPQTFSDHSPWWSEYRYVNDHAARLGVAMAEGVQQNRLLVLDPVTTGWMEYNPMIPPVYATAGYTAGDAALGHLREDYTGLVQWLCDVQVDHDLGNEALIGELARTEQGKLVLGECAYDLILIPASMKNLREEMLAMLEAYLAAGGRVAALGAAPTHVNGRPDARPGELAGRYASQWERYDSREALLAALDFGKHRSVAAQDYSPLPAGIHHHCRVLEDGQRLHLLVNIGHETHTMNVRLKGASVESLETFTGEIEAIPCDFYDCVGETVFALTLHPAAHALVRVNDEARTVAAPVTPEIAQTITLNGFASIERSEPNQLMIDFMDLTVRGRTREGLYTMEANRQMWRAQGFDQDVWDRAIQFRDNFTRMTFGDDTGFTAEYHFEIEPESFEMLRAVGELELAIENPHLYLIELNGKELHFDAGRRRLDETIRAVRVDDYVQPGKNTVTLIAKPFDIRCELERIYILGDFATDPIEKGFRISSPRPLTVGGWLGQGLCQYSGSVHYSTQIHLEKAASGLQLQLPTWTGAVVRVELDGACVGHIAFAPHTLKVDQALEAGMHELTIKVIGTPRNLLGPHFRGDSGECASPMGFEHYPDHAPAGSVYELEDYGLMGAVEVTVFG